MAGIQTSWRKPHILPICGLTRDLPFTAEMLNRLQPAAAILCHRGRNQPLCLVVTSSKPFVGKTTVAVHLGRTLAAQGKKVMLVDGHFRRPALSENLNSRNDTEKNHLESADSPPTPSQVRRNLWILPLARDLTPTHPEVNELATRLGIKALQEHYDFTLIDTPAMQDSDDAVAWGHYAGGAVFVVEREREGLADARKLIKGGVPILGLLLNRQPQRSGTQDHSQRWWLTVAGWLGLRA